MVIWAPRAIADLREAWDYIAEDNESAADRVISDIRTAGERLDRFPRLGHLGEITGTRELSVPRTRYFLVYRIHRTGVEIARVIHTSQLWPPKG